jgi:hypothetical protein
MCPPFSAPELTSGLNGRQNVESENVLIICELWPNIKRVKARRCNKLIAQAAVIIMFLLLFCWVSIAQKTVEARAERGSQTAKNGFQNESEIRDKFNNWKTDEDARTWLAAMNCKVSDIESVVASKPHGEKADVEVRIRMLPQSRKDAKTEVERLEGISIKLVSSPNGFNQIDKRWLATYAKMWKMPDDVIAALKLFVGETPPTRASRNAKRMFLNELDAAQQKAVVDFFTLNKDDIVSDIFAGDGVHDADWVMVALKATDKPLDNSLIRRHNKILWRRQSRNYPQRQSKDRSHHYATQRRRRRPRNSKDAAVQDQSGSAVRLAPECAAAQRRNGWNLKSCRRAVRTTSCYAPSSLIIFEFCSSSTILKAKQTDYRFKTADSSSMGSFP